MSDIEIDFRTFSFNKSSTRKRSSWCDRVTALRDIGSIAISPPNGLARSTSIPASVNR